MTSYLVESCLDNDGIIKIDNIENILTEIEIQYINLVSTQLFRVCKYNHKCYIVHIEHSKLTTPSSKITNVIEIPIVSERIYKKLSEVFDTLVNNKIHIVHEKIHTTDNHQYYIDDMFYKKSIGVKATIQNKPFLSITSNGITFENDIINEILN